jgi:hypothetical protein
MMRAFPEAPEFVVLAICGCTLAAAEVWLRLPF